MRSVRRLLLAFYVTLAVYLGFVVRYEASTTGGCDANDTTNCDFVGYVGMWSTLLLPGVLIPLLLILCVATASLLREMRPREWLRQPPVLAVLGTLGLLGATILMALFGDLEGLVDPQRG